MKHRPLAGAQAGTGADGGVGGIPPGEAQCGAPEMDVGERADKPGVAVGGGGGGEEESGEGGVEFGEGEDGGGRGGEVDLREVVLLGRVHFGGVSFCFVFGVVG